jgi:hypothetical protein
MSVYSGKGVHLQRRGQVTQIREYMYRREVGLLR